MFANEIMQKFVPYITLLSAPTKLQNMIFYENCLSQKFQFTDFLLLWLSEEHMLP